MFGTPPQSICLYFIIQSANEDRFEAIESDLEIIDLGDGISTTIGKFSNWLPEVAVKTDNEW